MTHELGAAGARRLEHTLQHSMQMAFNGPQANLAALALTVFF